MDITLLHAGLAAGAALAAIPVILHLFMRQTPKHVIFPALRLIKERQKKSKKQLKVKNWLLLVARMLLFALMALALARPTLNSEGALGDGEVPTAMALVFDTSMSMEYLEQGKDRLAEAKLRAAEILKKTKDESEVFVFDSANPVKPVGVSPGAAMKRVEALELKAANGTLNAAVLQANQVVAASNLSRREVYVLTDLATSAWELSSPRTTEELERIRKAKTIVKNYILRLTPKVVEDVAVVSADPSSTVVAEGEPVEIRATIRRAGPALQRVAEFWLDGDNKKDQKVVDLPANGEKEVTFVTPSKLEPGLHQGKVKLSGSDFMAFDDVRYFSFTVAAPVRVLLVADVATNQDLDAWFVQNALAPSTADAGGSSFKVDRDTKREFQAKTKATLKDYACIYLLNIDKLGPTDWSRLSNYVQQGGGLIVAPGERADPADYNSTAAMSILPASMGKEWVSKPTTFGRAEYDHPLFNRFSKELDRELSAWSIYKHWKVTPVEGSRSILRYADGDPAILERTFKGPKTGHVFLWTTPLSRRVSPDSPAAWNEFPNSWAFLGLQLEAIPYLAGTAGEKLNYEAGQDAVLTVDPKSKATNYIVQGPEAKLTERLSAPDTSDTLLISAPSKQGQWKVEGKGPDGSQKKLGFSVNVPEAESQVVALKPNDLDGLFGGKDNYQIADTQSDLKRIQDIGRYGTDLFPYIMFFILGLVTAESVLANKFHRDKGQVPSGPRTPTR